jgi:mono/diheme cytochrome c family protein
MIPARMSWPFRVLITSASIAVAALASGCGTQKISVPRSDTTSYQGAVLFSQRCSGCHTLSYAATHGSANNPRTAQFNNGPNFDQRCERPVTRVLYAIQNGGFSGAIMPQNVVVGQQADEVAEFVAKYSGRQEQHVPGVPTCQSQPIGTIPPPPSLTTTTSSSSTTTSSTTTTTAAKSAKKKPKK